MTIAGIAIRDLAPASSSGSAMTKVGRLSLRGSTSDGTRVKLVEAHSAAHALLIEHLAAGELADVLPVVLGVEGPLVVSEWVDRAQGTPDPDATALSILLARIHATPVPTIDPGFDAWADHVLPRARRAAAALGAADRLESLVGPALQLAGTTRPRVLHPDLTPDNVVPRRDGGLTVVDNELLSLGATPWLDLANLARGLSAGRGEVLATYRGAGGGELDADALPGVRSMWLARMVGSLFIAGRLADTRSLLDAGIEGVRLPFER